MNREEQIIYDRINNIKKDIKPLNLKEHYILNGEDKGAVNKIELYWRDIALNKKDSLNILPASREEVILYNKIHGITQDIKPINLKEQLLLDIANTPVEPDKPPIDTGLNNLYDDSKSIIGKSIDSKGSIITSYDNKVSDYIPFENNTAYFSFIPNRVRFPDTGTRYNNLYDENKTRKKTFANKHPMVTGFTNEPTLKYLQTTLQRDTKDCYIMKGNPWNEITIMESKDFDSSGNVIDSNERNISTYLPHDPNNRIKVRLVSPDGPVIVKFLTYSYNVSLDGYYTYTVSEKGTIINVVSGTYSFSVSVPKIVSKNFIIEYILP